MEAGLVDLLSFGLLPSTPSGNPEIVTDPTRGLRAAIAQTCLSLLPEAIGLSGAFGFSDWELDRSVVISISYKITLMNDFGHRVASALGVYDGRVYQELWERIQHEPLNAQEVTPGYEVCRPFFVSFALL